MKHDYLPGNPGAPHLVRLAACIALLVVIGALMGCAGQPQTQTVKVPVPVECREQVPDRPAMPSDGLSVGQPLDTGVAALLAEIEQREGYEGKLLAALQGCIKPLAPPD